MPLHNVEYSVSLTVPALLNNTRSLAEVAFVLDACTDSTEELLWSALVGAPANARQHFIRAIVFRSAQALYEVASDNFALRSMVPMRYYSCVQADTLVALPGWDLL